MRLQGKCHFIYLKFGSELTAKLYNSLSNKKVELSSSTVMISEIKSNKPVSFLNKILLSNYIMMLVRIIIKASKNISHLHYTTKQIVNKRISCSLNFSYRINLRPWWKEKVPRHFFIPNHGDLHYLHLASHVWHIYLRLVSFHDIYTEYTLRRWYGIYWSRINKTKHHEKQEVFLPNSVQELWTKPQMFGPGTSFDLKVLLHDPTVSWA